jgi:membrane protein DedA with SNARE-associated domain
MIDFIVNNITALISIIGYFGVFILMTLESTMIPIPSEAVMPFAGFLAASGGMSLIAVIAVSILASLTGSLISYWIGMNYGYRFVRKFGKYFLVDEAHLLKAEKWFKTNGGKTIFFSRFIPGIRHIISVPAGVGKMNIAKFSMFTVVGAGIWNSFLAILGFELGKNWIIVQGYTIYADIIVIFLAVIAIAYYLSRIINYWKRR